MCQFLLKKKDEKKKKKRKEKQSKYKYQIAEFWESIFPIQSNVNVINTIKKN